MHIEDRAEVKTLRHAAQRITGVELADGRVLDADLVIDLKMPGMSGLSAIGEISGTVPSVGIIVFTMYDNPAYVWETMNSGARGYLLKSASQTVRV